MVGVFYVPFAYERGAIHNYTISQLAGACGFVPHVLAIFVSFDFNSAPFAGHYLTRRKRKYAKRKYASSHNRKG